MSASNTLHIKFTTLLIRLAADKRVPLASSCKESVEQGALFAYAPDAAAFGRQAATVIDKILKGGSPGHLPVEQPSKFGLIINLKTAKVLGIAIPRCSPGRSGDRVVNLKGVVRPIKPPASYGP